MSGAELKQRLAAILAADAVGYSRLMAADERATVAALDAARSAFRKQIEANQGRVIDMAGDSVLAVFETATGAVSAALAVQRELDVSSSTLPDDRRMCFRIGVHLGDVIEKADGTVYGDGVNIAARLEGLAEPGGITVSESIRTAVKGKVSASFEDQGEQAVKNIVEPVRAFAVRASGAAATKPSRAAGDIDLSLPDKPSIAVLPFSNMSGDPEQEYFTDGITEDIITELSRFRALFVIARNSTFTYKDKAVDVRQVARELGVRYVLEGGIRKAGNRVRVTAQLIDAVTGNHLWAERYDRTLEDVFAVQEDVTRAIVAAVAPEVELAEVAAARRASPNDDAVQLSWRARGLLNDAMFKGQPSLMLEAIAAAQQAIAADPASLSAHWVLAGAHRYCHLYRWGPEPGKALDAAWSAVERMLSIDARDYRTLTQCGMVRVMRGEKERGIADLRRALDSNPNSAITLIMLAWAEATAGLGEEATAHALLSLRLSPRDISIGTAQLALAMASYSAREYAEAVRWAELAIQSQPKAPIRRTILIACCARAGDQQRAAQERAVLDGFAPGFIASLFRGENRVFTRPEDMEHLLDGLRLAAGEAT